MASRRPSPPKTLRTQMGPFVILPVWVLEAVQDARALQLYVVLGRFANRQGRAWPTRATLLEALHTSPRNLDRAIATLKDAGAIEITLRHRPSDGAVIGVDYLLLQVKPGTEDHLATGGEMDRAAFSPENGGLFATGGDASKEELDPLNQIQEQKKRAPEARPLPLLGAATGPKPLDPTDPCAAFLLAWNAVVVPPLKPVLELTAKRRRRIQARLAERPLEVWRGIMARIAASAFCKGAKGFVMPFDWLIKTPEPGLHALEGQYDDEARLSGVADRAAAIESGTDVWSTVLQAVSTQMNRHDWYTWFVPTRLLEDRGDVLIVTADDPIRWQFIEKHFSAPLARALAGIRPHARVEWAATEAPAVEPQQVSA